MEKKNPFPVTLEEFKTFFLRESGVEWQPFDNWEKTVWDTGDLCFKDGVFYRSLVDLNRIEPPATPVPVPGFPTIPAWEALNVIWKEDTEYLKGMIVYYAPDDAWYEALEDVPVELPEDRTWESYWKRLDPKIAFPDARPWKQPIAYKKGDKVIRIVKFKPGVWVSNASGNYTDPAKGEMIPNQDPEVPWWEESEDDNLDMEDWVLDWDILRAMGEAMFKFNPGLFTLERGKMIFLYLTMFFLVYDRQMANSGLNGNNAAGPVIHRTVGKMSVTYMESKLFKNYPSYEFLSSNEYGKKAFNLMMPYLRGNVQVIRGMASGE